MAAAEPGDGEPGPAAVDFGPLTPAGFLRGYWQKEPLLLRGALPAPRAFDAESFLEAACSEDADARLITGDGADAPWHLDHAPLERDDIPESLEAGSPPWTVLLRHGELWRPELARLQRAFGFVPLWRHQDVMVSYASPGGSVGPHVDQYDVFLLQGPGTRRWAIGDPDAEPTLTESGGLHFISDFREVSSWVLEPGDMLYLPPGVPHHGVAESACFTYSIGFRAPSAAELLWALATLLDERGGGRRLADPDLTLAEAGPSVADPAATRAATLLKNALADPTLLTEALARWASDPIAEPPDIQEPDTQDETPVALQWRRAPGSRMALASDAVLYADGEPVHLDPGTQALASAIASDILWSTDGETLTPAETDLLHRLAEHGLLEEPDEG